MTLEELETTAVQGLRVPRRLGERPVHVALVNAVHEEAIDARDGNVFGHREARAILGKMEALDVGERYIEVGEEGLNSGWYFHDGGQKASRRGYWRDKI
jgi:hypothetical protein